MSVDDAKAMLARQRADRDAPPPRRRQGPGVIARARRKATLMLGASIALLLALFVTGLFTPVGTTGVMILGVILLLVNIGIMLSRSPAPRPVDPATLPKTALARLPVDTDRWLQGQRALLPAPAQRLSDTIGVKLEALAPQLSALDEREPIAAQVRRLLADELPGLVKGYAKVPPAMRAEGLDGLAPDAQLLDGLRVVDAELTRVSEQLARGDVEALATQGKYLEYKYRGDPT